MDNELVPIHREIEASVPPTLIAVILDESGSMGVKWEDVVAGFNRFLHDQRALPDSCRMSLTKFNTVCSLLYPPTPVALAPELDKLNYTPAGNTALFDAIAETVRVAQNHQHDGERVLCLIITDGHENASRETTAAQVTHLIKALEARGDWTFVYLGVSPEQFVEEMHLTGTRMSSNTAMYNAASPGQSWDKASQGTVSFRRGRDKSAKDFYKQESDD